jgi:ABC-type taurine transport system ATPase subunit
MKSAKGFVIDMRFKASNAPNASAMKITGTAMADVQLIGVHKRFGQVEALRGIDLVIPDGAYVCLLGPSGCGNTTLLRCVAGLETVDAGEIRIGSRSVEALEPFARNVGLAFQNYALYPTSTFGGISRSRYAHRAIGASSMTRRSNGVLIRWRTCFKSKSCSRSPSSR